MSSLDVLRENSVVDCHSVQITVDGIRHIVWYVGHGWRVGMIAIDYSGVQVGNVLVSALAKMATSASRSSNKKSNGSESPKKSGSPKKKNLLEVRVSSSKQARKLTYLFRIMKLKPDVEIIWCDKTPRDDAFIHHLVKHIEEENGFREQGILMVCHRHVGRLDNSIRFNENDAFPRRLIVRVVDESTAQDRMAVLMLLRDFMMRPENNRYGYEYQVNETSDASFDDQRDEIKKNIVGSYETL